MAIQPSNSVGAPGWPLDPQANRRPQRTYDHADFHASIRPSDVFICSFPKSGTTWLGYLLAQLLKQDADESLNLKTFNRYLPDVNLEYTKKGSLKDYADRADPRLFLCHATCDERLPKVVYVLRDPRDTMVSYWHYRKFLDSAFDLSLEAFLCSGDHWPCEWDEHAAGWLLPRKHPNLVVVRYEELHTNPGKAVAEVFALAGIEATPDRIAVAIDAARFDKMRSAEEKFGVHGKADQADERFVRKGKVGSWQEEMSPEAISILEARYGHVMAALGYPLSRA